MKKKQKNLLGILKPITLKKNIADCGEKKRGEDKINFNLQHQNHQTSNTRPIYTGSFRHTITRPINTKLIYIHRAHPSYHYQPNSIHRAHPSYHYQPLAYTGPIHHTTTNPLAYTGPIHHTTTNH